MGKINAQWHKAHKMPNPPAGGPSKKERYLWHIEHSKNCDCREMSESLKAEVKAWQDKK